MKMNIRLEKLSDPKSPINWWHNWDESPSLLSLFSALLTPLICTSQSVSLINTVLIVFWSFKIGFFICLFIHK